MISILVSFQKVFGVRVNYVTLSEDIDPMSEISCASTVAFNFFA